MTKDVLIVTPGFKNTDPAQTGFQFLEDLSTAYWYSQVLFTALELELFGFMDKGPCTVEELACAVQCPEPELGRLVAAMERLGLVACHDHAVYNSQVAALFLVPGKKDYMGEFFLYRQYLGPRWETLTQKVSGRKKKPVPELSYVQKNDRYVAAMDTLVRQKALEIAGLLRSETITGDLLDIGGGAGSLVRAIHGATKQTGAIVFDIPEVIESARRLYPDDSDWDGIQSVGGDFRTHAFDRTFGLVCMSNFLHAYGHDEAKELFLRAVGLLDKTGLILIHDYFPDRRGGSPQKGALYDINMMLNTFNGACHDAKTLVGWCEEEGLKSVAIKDLETDTAVLLARRTGSLLLPENSLQDAALDLGFEDIIPVNPRDIITVPWAREKCRFGCSLFGKGLQCPPYGIEHEKMRQILDSYTAAFLVKGAPPGKAFHTALLALERKAFLDGYHKALVFGAGPCTVCTECPADGQCRFPNLARPSMEGSGIDVYDTAVKAGLHLTPVQEKGQYITYIGLLLVE